MDVPRVLIAAAGSGSGKTTIACGILAALRRRGLRVRGGKAGPDYLDTGHLRRAAGAEGAVCNLDPWMTGRAATAGLFARVSQDADIAVVEGVMGLYDGEGTGASSAEIARLLRLPVVLVLNAQAMGESAAAVALGFREYDPSIDLRGVILNGLGSDSHRDRIAEALKGAGIPLLGALRRDDALTLPSRHLGLVPVEESADNDGYVDRVCRAVERDVDLDAVLNAARSAPPLDALPLLPFHPIVRGVRVAVARDAAFSFYYPESLNVLEEMGAELVPFSPIKDQAPPKGVHGLILGGGFPEVFAEGLEANPSMRRAVAQMAASGFPVWAECGGLIYLSQSITAPSGRVFGMAGALPAACRMNDRLQAVGYVEAAALEDTVLCPKGATLRGHEFHFSSLTPLQDDFPSAFTFTKKRTGMTYPGGYARGNVLASYLHVNLLGAPAAAERFLRRCEERAFRKKA